MRRCFLILMGVLLLSTTLRAQDNLIIANSKIKAVTVFTDRALVTRSVEATLEPGSFRIQVPGLPSGLIDNSIRVSSKGMAGAKISGVKVEKDLSAESSSDRIKEIESHIAALDQRNIELTDRSAVLKQEGEFIKALSQKTSESIAKNLPAERPSVADWTGMVKFVDDNLNKINKEMRAIESEQRDIAAQRGVLASKLGDYQAGNIKAGKMAVIDLIVEKGGSYSLDLAYMIYGASWHPVYDIRAWSDTNEVEVIFMAQVNQQTGEDWDNVSLILSTARPSEGANPPVLAAWYLNTYDQSRFRGGLQDIIVTAEKKDIDKYITAQVPMEQAASQYSSAEVVQTAISTSFALEKKETIPSNKEFKKVPVKAVSFMAETENYIVPRLSEAAYLKASVKSNVDFPLLAGEANVFFDNNFVSTSRLPNVLTDEKFDLFFGINEGIRVKRELVKKFIDDAGLTGNKRQIEYEYKINAENYTKSAQKIIVLDQIPVSQNDDIDVKLLSIKPEPDSEPDDKAKGFLRWVTNMNKGDKSEYTFKYQVKYPGDMVIGGLE
ncbi:MAG: hypothetical protein A2W25_00225 [candidate division Zixibacteria bacterium RBG_16_53_22]|nr:MAG: hypothetical protein A2W25_00225 [candidate division Zixibacteria bacterium RBG_16_53_22]